MLNSPCACVFHSSSCDKRHATAPNEGAVTPGLSGDRGSGCRLELTNIPPGRRFCVCLIDFKRWTQLLISFVSFLSADHVTWQPPTIIKSCALLSLARTPVGDVSVWELKWLSLFSASFLKSFFRVTNEACFGLGSLRLLSRLLFVSWMHHSSRVGCFSIFTIYLLFFRAVGFHCLCMRIRGLKIHLLLSTCILNSELCQRKRKHFLCILTEWK